MVLVASCRQLPSGAISDVRLSLSNERAGASAYGRVRPSFPVQACPGCDLACRVVNNVIDGHTQSGKNSVFWQSLFQMPADAPFCQQPAFAKAQVGGLRFQAPRRRKEVSAAARDNRLLKRRILATFGGGMFAIFILGIGREVFWSQPSLLASAWVWNALHPRLASLRMRCLESLQGLCDLRVVRNIIWCSCFGNR